MDQEVWDYSVLTAIARGWGLAIRCRSCWSERRWSDRALAERFSDRLDVAVAQLRGALVCVCGVRSPILYFYMSGSLDTGAGMENQLAAKEASLRQIFAGEPRGDLARAGDSSSKPPAEDPKPQALKA